MISPRGAGRARIAEPAAVEVGWAPHTSSRRQPEA